ncbi:MAG: PH domain-containing protein [Candidatus Thorarchaeota archaeon]
MDSPDGRVIKPPVESVVSGRIFKPAPAFRNKKALKFVLLALALWAVFYLVFFANPWFSWLLREGLRMEYGLEIWFLEDTWVTGSQWYWILTMIWLIPALVWTHLYVRGIEYSLVAYSGETMPEVFQKKGIITIVRKHVPFRSITNISTRAGLLDRLFGIGVVRIETAGQSDGAQYQGLFVGLLHQLSKGPGEQRIEGITFYEEARNFILKELRIFKGSPLATTPERRLRKKGSFFRESTLVALREIRDGLVAKRTHDR